LDQAADAVATVLAADLPELLPLIDLYLEHAEQIAQQEVAAVLGLDSPDQIIRGVVIGTVVGGALLDALRLLAQQSASIKLLGPSTA
jgi:hypothetical protein